MDNIPALAAALEKLAVPLIETHAVRKTFKERGGNFLYQIEKEYKRQVRKIARRDIYLESLERLRNIKKARKNKRRERDVIRVRERRAFKEIEEKEEELIREMYEKAARLGIEKSKLKVVRVKELQGMTEWQQDFLRWESYLLLNAVPVDRRKKKKSKKVEKEVQIAGKNLSKGINLFGGVPEVNNDENFDKPRSVNIKVKLGKKAAALVAKKVADLETEALKNMKQIYTAKIKFQHPPLDIKVSRKTAPLLVLARVSVPAGNLNV